MRPVLQALVLADRVYEDKPSGKKIIDGTFNRILLNRKVKLVENHPTDDTKKLIRAGGDIGSPYIYLSLTDLVPETDLTLQFVNVSMNQVVLELPFKIKCDSRLATVELAIALPPLTAFVNEPGTYSVDLLWNGEILGSQRVVAEDVPEKK